MDGATVDLIGGIFGGVAGTMGGVLGTYVSIKSAKGPIERAFIKKTAVICLDHSFGVSWLTSYAS